MDARSFFQSKGTYLNASHVPDGELNLTISNAEPEKMRDKEEKIVIYFQEHDRGLPLNKTNGDTVMAAFGGETKDWIGGKVTLFKVATKYNDADVDGVRLRVEPANYLPMEKRTPPSTAPAEKSSKDDMNDLIPF